jgi:LSD1 subclass zinc finger protein
LEDKKTTAERTAAGRSSGKFRCHNCMTRIAPPAGAKQVKCENCGFEWRVSWLGPTFPRIRGPVWDVNRRLTEEALKARENKE